MKTAFLSFKEISVCFGHCYYDVFKSCGVILELISLISFLTILLDVYGVNIADAKMGSDYSIHRYTLFKFRQIVLFYVFLSWIVE